MMETTPNLQTYQLSKKIYSQLQQINDLIEPFNVRLDLSENEMFNILQAVAKEMPKLFTLLSESFKISAETAGEAFKQRFLFPGSQQEASLFHILSYTYSVVIDLQKNACYPLISDENHIKYATKIVDGFESGLGYLI